jgi:hypothetical protein
MARLGGLFVADHLTISDLHIPIRYKPKSVGRYSNRCEDHNASFPAPKVLSRGRIHLLEVLNGTVGRLESWRKTQRRRVTECIISD